MVLDPLDEEDEPAEFQAGEDIGPSPPDPPSVDVPSVETPETSTGPGPTVDVTDVPEEVAKPFWKAVVTLNLAVFAASLGPMLAYFRGQFLQGGLVFLLGLLAFGQTYRIYRNYHRERTSADPGGTDGE